VRVAALALSAVAVIAAAIVRDRRSDTQEPVGSNRSGDVAGIETDSTHLGPRSGGRGWMPSSNRPRSVVWAVGDAADGSPTSRRVATMVKSRRPDLLLYLGDVYDTGTRREYQRNYRPLYGVLGSTTAPTIGNHEWPNVATGYVPYWTKVRGTPPPFWYAFAVSGWQLISLNSNVPSSADQLQWLGNLLDATPEYGNCRIAFFHHPYLSTGPHGGLLALKPIFDELKERARIMLSGHDHDMQRFQPIHGVTQLVAGSGGAELYPFINSNLREAFGDDTHHGALRLRLRLGHATATFVSMDGTALDRSPVSCTR
jgi:3',5'-cyclic AMP phosphodiesterase CpdA